MAIKTTYGDARNFTTSALMGLGATQQDANGRFYVDGSMVNVELSRVIAESVYIKRIFRDGQSVTGKYTTSRERGGAVRVMLNMPLPFSSRTLSYGGRTGTNGNGGVINVNSPMLPNNDEFMVYLNQVNDQQLAFPDVSAEYIPLDIMSSRIAQYADRVSMDRDASTLAEIIAYNVFRSLNDGNNLITSTDFTQENEYANIFNQVNSKMDNGDEAQGAYTYPTEGRTIIGRPDFINGIFSRNSGVIMLGGDLAQTMLADYDLDGRMSDRGYVGTGYKGHAMGLHFQTAPDYIWTLAEKYLGLAPGALASVKAIAVSAEATAVANGVDLGVKLVPATQFRGTLAQPLNIWGHEAFRKSYLIGTGALNNSMLTTAGFSAEARKHPIAPAAAATSDKINVPVLDAEGNVVAYREIANVPQPNGDNIQSGVTRE